MCTHFPAGSAGHAHRRVAALCLLAATLAVPSFAYAASSLSLPDAVRLAVSRAPMLAARRSSLEAARQDARRAGALPDPTLSVGVNDLPVTGSDAFNFSNDNFTMTTVGVMQAFPARAKRNARQAVADRAIDQAVAMTTAESWAVERETAQAWVSLWASGRELNAVQALRDQSRLAADTASARLRGGSGMATDVLAAKAAVLQLDNRLETAHSDVESARAMARRWLGEDIDAASEAPDFTRLPISASTLLASIDRQGPLLPWSAREQVASAQVDLASAEKSSDWSVSATYGHRNRYSDFFSIELSVGLPLFPGNRQDRDVAARRADYEATLDAHEDARRVQRQQVESDLAKWAGLARQVERDDSHLLPLAHDRTTVALAAYRAGAALQPWLDALRDEIQIHVAHAQMSGDLGRAWASLAYLLPSETQP